MYRGRYAAVFLAVLIAILHPSPADAKCVTVTITSTGQTSTSCDGAPDADAPTGTTPGDKTAPDAADAQCPAPDSTHKYDATKGKTWTEIRYDVKVTIQNLYGKRCQDTEGKAVA
ncbi:MAG TPA: hypothetical protein VHD38_01445, partial [Candidatus Paceibacterota bacterium]|nr:hypothetical protein [Candidatus Paceibacterota bacterium]